VITLLVLVPLAVKIFRREISVPLVSPEDDKDPEILRLRKQKLAHDFRSFSISPLPLPFFEVP
jgi:hypothetical protein